MWTTYATEEHLHGLHNAITNPLGTNYLYLYSIGFINYLKLIKYTGHDNVVLEVWYLE